MKKQELIRILKNMAKSESVREWLKVEDVILMLENEKLYEEMKGIWLKEGVK